MSPTLQTQEEVGVVSFNVLPAVQSAVSEEAARPPARAAVVAPIRAIHQGPHLTGPVPEELETCQRKERRPYFLSLSFILFCSLQDCCLPRALVIGCF